jgi:fatty acid desaturase
MLLLEGLQLKVASVQTLLRRDAGKGRWGELGLIAVHIGLFAALLVLSGMSWPVLLVFVVVQQGLFGLYLGLSFAPNHKGMPVLSEEEARDFLRRQVLTSRNVRGGWFVDHALGALNYQIEHHLFPSMPRSRLAAAQPIVREFCAEVGVGYTEESLIGSYRRALGHLHEVGAPLRTREATA